MSSLLSIFYWLFFRITVYPLINRVTLYTVFQQHIINEYLDNIIVIVATTSWLLLSVNNRVIRYYFSIAYGGVGIISAVISPDNNIIFDIITLLSLPLIISVTLYYYYYQRQKDNLNSDAKLTLRYISLAVIAISAIGIVFHVSSVFLTPHLESFNWKQPRK